MKMVTKLKIFLMHLLILEIFFQEYDPQKLKKTLKAGAKKLDFIAVLAIFVDKFCHCKRNVSPWCKDTAVSSFPLD